MDINFKLPINTPSVGIMPIKVTAISLPKIAQPEKTSNDVYVNSAARFGNTFKTSYDEYKNYIQGANYQLGGLDAMRSINQSGLEMAEHSFAQLGGTILGQVIAGSGSLIKLIANPISYEKMLLGNDTEENYNDSKDNIVGEFGNILETAGMAVQKGIEKALPIHQSETAIEGGWGKFGDASWWAAMFPTVGSAVASFVPVLGAMKGLNVTASLLREVGAANRALRIGETANALGRGFQNSKIAQTLTATLFSTHLDVMQEVANQYEDEVQYAHTQLGMDEPAARKYAAEWAASSYRKGFMATSIFELAEMHALLGSGKFVNRFMSDNMEKVTDRYIAKATTVAGGGLAKAGESIAETAVVKEGWKKAFDLAKVSIGEAGQEMSVDLALAEGKRQARESAGFEDFSPKEFSGRLIDFLSKGKSWDSGIWGAIGGTTMIAGRGLVQKTLYKDAHEKELQLVKTNLDTLQKIGDTLNTFKETESDPVQTAKDKLDVLIPIAINAVSRGTFNMTNKFVDAIVNLGIQSDADLTTMGYTRDSISAAKTLQKELQRANEIYSQAYGMTFDAFNDNNNQALQTDYATNKYAANYFLREQDQIYTKIQKRISEIQKELNDQSITLPEYKIAKENELRKLKSTITAHKGLITKTTKTINSTLESLNDFKQQLIDLQSTRKTGRKSAQYIQSEAELKTAIATHEALIATHQTNLDSLNKQLSTHSSDYQIKKSEFDKLDISDLEKENLAKFQFRKDNDLDLLKLQLLDDAYNAHRVDYINKLSIYSDPALVTKRIEELNKKSKSDLDVTTQLHIDQINSAVDKASIDRIVETAKSKNIDLSKEAEARLKVLAKEEAIRKQQDIIDTEQDEDNIPSGANPDLIQRTNNFGFNYTEDKLGNIQSTDIATEKNDNNVNDNTRDSVVVGDIVIPYVANDLTNAESFKVLRLEHNSDGNVDIILETKDGKEIALSPHQVYKQGSLRPTNYDTKYDYTERDDYNKRLDALLKTFNANEFLQLLNEGVLRIFHVLSTSTTITDTEVKLQMLQKLKKLFEQLKESDFATPEQYKTELDTYTVEVLKASNIIKNDAAKFSLQDPIRRLLFNHDVSGFSKQVQRTYFDLMEVVIRRLATAYRYENGKIILWNNQNADNIIGLHITIQDVIKTIPQRILNTPSLEDEFVELSKLLTITLKSFQDFRGEFYAASKIKEIEHLNKTVTDYINNLSKVYSSEKDSDKLNQIKDTLKQLSKRLNTLNQNQGFVIGYIAATSIVAIRNLYDKLNNLLSEEDKISSAFRLITNQYETLTNTYNTLEHIRNNSKDLVAIEDAVFKELSMKMVRIWGAKTDSTKETISDLIDRSSDLDGFNIRTFLNYSENLDADKVSPEMKRVLESLQSVLFDQIGSSLEMIEEIISTYRALTSNQTIPLTFDNMLSVLAYGDENGVDNVDANWINLYESLRLIEDTFLTPTFLKFMDQTIANTDPTAANYDSLTSDRDVLLSLKNNLVPIPRAKDYVGTKHDFFTIDGEMKQSYITDWKRNSPVELGDQTFKDGTKLTLDLLTHLNSVLDETGRQYTTDTIVVDGETFRIEDIYGAYKTLSRGSTTFIDTTGLDLNDTKTVLKAYIIYKGKKLTIGSLNISNLTIGQHVDSRSTLGIPLTKTINGVVVFSNYFTEKHSLNQAIDQLSLKGYFDILKQFYKEYSAKRQTNNHNHERYDKLFEQLKNTNLISSKGETLYNWLRNATGENINEDGPLNAHKVAAILSTIFYRVPINMIDDFRPKPEVIKSKFKRYENKLYDNFIKTNIERRNLEDQRSKGIDIVSIPITHISKPSINFGDDNTTANILDNELIPTVNINGTQEFQIVSTMAVTSLEGTSSVVSNLTSGGVINFESITLKNELLHRNKTLFTAVDIFDGEAGRSFIPLRTSTLGLFSNSEYAQKSKKFVFEKMLELLNADFNNQTLKNNSLSGVPNETGIYKITKNVNGKDITYSTTDILDDLSEVISIDNNDHSIAEAAKLGNNIYFKFHKIYVRTNPLNGNQKIVKNKIEFRTVDENGKVTFHKIEREAIHDGKDFFNIKFTYKTVPTKSVVDKIGGKKIRINKALTKTSKGETKPAWVIKSEEMIDTVGDIPKGLVHALNLPANKAIEKMIRSIPLQTDPSNIAKMYKVKAKGISIGQNHDNVADLTKSYTSVVDGKTYRNFQDFLVKSGAIYTNATGIRTKDGKIVSNYTLNGKYPPVIHIGHELEEKPEQTIDTIIRLQGDNFIEKLLNNENNALGNLGINNELVKQFLNIIKSTYGDMSLKYLSNYAEYRQFLIAIGKRNNEILNGDSLEYINELAMMSNSTKTIALKHTINNFNNSNNRFKLELFHEMLHAAVKGALNDKTNKVVKAEINQYIKEFINRLTANKHNLTTDEQKTLNNWIDAVHKNHEEFITYPITNESLISILNKLEYVHDDTKRTVWDDILDFIVKLLTGTTVKTNTELSSIRSTISKILSRSNISGNFQSNEEHPVGTNDGGQTRIQPKDLTDEDFNNDTEDDIDIPYSTNIDASTDTINTSIDTKLSSNNSDILNNIRIFKQNFIDANNLKIC